MIGFFQPGQGGLRHHEGGAVIHGLYQVVFLQRGVFDIGDGQRAGIVDEDVDTAKGFGGLGHGRHHLGFFAHIDLQRQGAATGGHDFFSHGINGAGQLVVGLGRLCSDHDVGAIARATQGNGAANATAAAGDEDGAIFQCGHGGLTMGIVDPLVFVSLGISVFSIRCFVASLLRCLFNSAFASCRLFCPLSPRERAGVRGSCK